MRRIFAICIWIVVVFSSCTWNFSKSEKKDNKGEVKIHRYDQLLHEYVSYNSFSALQKLNTEYPQETRLLIEEVLSIGEVEDPNINVKLRMFFQDSIARKLMHDTSVKYANLHDIESKLTNSFANLKDEVPSIRIPRVYTQISALNQSIIVSDSILGISLDKYLGSDYPLYKTYFYNYQIRSMKPERMVPDCILFYLYGRYPLPESQSRFFEQMLYVGKMHWVTAHITKGSFEDELSYDDVDKRWIRQHLHDVWAYLNDKHILFSENPTLIRSYLQASPYTMDFGEESPDQLGAWLGILIIDSYMKSQDVSIAQLLNERDYKKILQESQFNP